MRKTAILAAALACALLLCGCETGEIPFSEGQFYAVAHLGYQDTGRLDSYTQSYLDGVAPPVHYLSSGDYYLVIPRYEGMEMSLYRGDIVTGELTLLYEDPNCRPFVVQCNASDIFADATIVFEYDGERVEFSPFISLKDGSLDVGERGFSSLTAS